MMAQGPAGPVAIAPGVDSAPGARVSRTAWKKPSPVIGRASGVALLVVAAVTILGALFVMFSLME